MKTNVKKSIDKKTTNQASKESKLKKNKKEERSRNPDGKGAEPRKKEERSKNVETDKKNTKVAKNEKKVKKTASSTVTKEAPVVVKTPEEQRTLRNKKKFCKNFFVEALDGKQLMKDFVALRSAPCVAEVMKQHSEKCRYYDIMCPDATRVVLLQRPPQNDFIHANWMTMPDKFRYISAQGPMEESLEDFWHMIYTEKSPAIVMICDWLEDGVQKCVRYIPNLEDKSQQFGIYQITRLDSPKDFCEDIGLQTFEVSIPNQPDAPIHTTKHYHYRNWRDHTAPMTSKSVLKLMKALRDPTSKGPPVIHCSAGVGRTATFIGVDYGNQRIGETGQLEILDLVREMRTMRDKAIQSHHQYIFMLVCISDLMVSEGVPRNEDMTDLADFYKAFMLMTKKKREAEEKKKADELAEKEKKEREETEKKEKEEAENNVDKTQDSTCSTTQDTI